MNIVHVMHGFPPRNIAGSEVYADVLSRELARTHEVHVFHRIHEPERSEYELQRTTDRGLTIWTINNTFRECQSFEQTYRNEAIAGKFGECLDEVRPDVVHVGHLTNLSTTLVTQAKERGIPVVFTLHDFWLFCQLGQLLKHDLSLCNGPQESQCAKCLAPQLALRPSHREAYDVLRNAMPRLLSNSRLDGLLRAIYRQYARFVLDVQRQESRRVGERTRHILEICSQVDLFVAPSRFLLEKFVQFGVPRSKMVYLDYGFDTARIASVPHRPSSTLRFGYTGTFIPSKGVHVLLEAFNSLDGADIELRLHGRFASFHDGYEDYPDRLRALANRRNVVWCGEYGNADIGRILSEIDVLVVPSIWYENSPLTIHEAFLAGVPVITTGIGGMAELVKDGVNGLLFEVGNAHDLARRMQALIDDRRLVERLRENIEPIVDIQRHAAQIEELYSRVSAANLARTV